MSIGRLPNIHRSRKYEPLVQRLCMEKEPGISKTLFPTIREFMCFCALLGYSLNKRIPLDKSMGPHEDIAGVQFEQGDAEEIVFMIALAERKDASILQPGKESEAALIFEEYAFGGMATVDDWIRQHGADTPDVALQAGLRNYDFLVTEQQTLFELNTVKF